MSGPALVSGQARYILVVDADWNERFTLSMLLQRFGYTVASSSSVEECVEFLCVAPAVAVFTDAGRNGEDLARRLRTDARFRDMPVVVVSDGPDARLDERVRDGELAATLSAPVEPDAVFRVIQRVIEKGPRENIRIPTALKSQVRDEYGITDGYVTVLSQYGLFFRTMEPRPVGARTAVVISFEDRSVTAEATVLYIVSFEEGPFCEPGMGMKFVGIAPEDSSLLRLHIYEQLGAGILPGRAGMPSGSA